MARFNLANDELTYYKSVDIIKQELRKVNNSILKHIRTLEVRHQPTTNDNKLNKLIKQKNELVYLIKLVED